ncbi:MAG: cytochrome c oxidase subunit III [Alteromonadaceae bacterium]|nr:MAG: cytochrome c oxidase subunit III [Alteromonadaceae bacterium]
MGFISALTEKPWLAQGAGFGVGQVHVIDDETLSETKSIALKIFLGVVSVFFSLFIITFLARSQYPDFQALSGNVLQPFYNTRQLWLNTAFLFASSVCLQLAWLNVKREPAKPRLRYLWLAGLFGLQFLLAQLFLWRTMYGLGFYVSSNPANSYFYLFTGLHGLHLLGGLFVLCKAGVAYLRQGSDKQLRTGIRLCAIYWHYLFIVWLILFGLLVSSPETYKTLAALCGY